MSKKWFAALSIAVVLSFRPAAADPSDLQVVGTTVTSTHITFHVENTNTSPESARVQVAVLLADGSSQILTTEPVTVPASATATVEATASSPIVAISDEPDPVLP